MARCTCPSCGASWNGKRCRSCNYEHFSEEIAHRGHTHRGEPLIIDAPARKPIPTKDPFGCETRTKKTAFPRREKKQRPFAGLMTIFLLIYALLPLVRSWGLELEAREEEAARRAAARARRAAMGGAAAAKAPKGWTCSNCGTVNTGKFCTGCGDPIDPSDSF